MFTMVTEALSPIALPSSVVITVLPAVENVTPAGAMIVPTMVPPPAPLIVAALPTCQNIFLGCAPLTRMTLRGNPGAPTMSVEVIWKTQMAFTSSWASSVKSDPVIIRMADRRFELCYNGLERFGRNDADPLHADLLRCLSFFPWLGSTAEGLQRRSATPPGLTSAAICF